MGSWLRSLAMAAQASVADPPPAAPLAPVVVVVQAPRTAVLVTDAKGQGVLKFSPAFAAAPVVALAVEAIGDFPVLAVIASLSKDSLTVRAYAGRSLPNPLKELSALLGFNAFAGAGISGVRVHVTANGS